MPFFNAGGTIASEVLRRETRGGVLATVRMVSDQPRGGRLWIEVEAWGHLAGTLATHGTEGRAILVSGRLAQKDWSTTSGAVRRRVLVTANDIEFLAGSWPAESQGLRNTLTASGLVSSDPATRPSGDGVVTTFRLGSGRTGTKAGRIWIPVEHWTRGQDASVRRGDRVAVRGRLAYRPSPPDGTETARGQLVVKADEVLPLDHQANGR